jgi:hypothetical protein
MFSRAGVLTLVLVNLVVATLAGSFFPVKAYAADLVDFSYDKCRSPGSTKVATWVGHYKVGIIGVNAGGDWEKNTCLRNETKHFDGYMLYVNTNYPSDGCHQPVSRKAAYHCGLAAGIFDIKYANSQGAHSSLWWLDVEEGAGIPWAGNDTVNSAFLYGMAKAFEKHGIKVGWYSTSLQWKDITATGWYPGGFVWYATGSQGKPSSGTINDACHSNFTHGSQGVAFYQFIYGGLDLNNYC